MFLAAAALTRRNNKFVNSLIPKKHKKKQIHGLVYKFISLLVVIPSTDRHIIIEAFVGFLSFNLCTRRIFLDDS